MQLLVVLGPTASGKTELAIRLAQLVDGEIINADSVQIYRHFDIGAGKPTSEQLASIPHHLISCLDPHQPMDAARWVESAEERVADIRHRGKVPIVCGGTFLYVKALLYGLAPAPPADERIRARHRALVDELGRSALHAMLAKADPDSALRLAPNDFVRVSRALEVHQLSGVPMSEWQRQHGFRVPRHGSRLIGVGWDRETLHQRINQRVKAMVQSGWVDEVQRLVALGYRDARAMAAVGYKQVLESVESGTEGELSELIERISRATRIFARRQRTWLRDQPVEWLVPEADLGDAGAWLASLRE